MRQTRQKGRGQGFVVMDVDVTPEEAWLYFSDYKGYSEVISTVREASARPDRWSLCKKQVLTPATFKLSRFRLKVNVVFRRDQGR
eukprot:scaffold279_cov229-Pinguiococcus_pyrenoidosus.AAC.27